MGAAIMPRVLSPTKPSLSPSCPPSMVTDLWSIGVNAYILLCGYPPFYGKTDRDIFDSVRAGIYDFPSPEWDTVSDAAKDFVQGLLRLNPSERPTASEVCFVSYFLSFLLYFSTLITPV